MTTVQNLEEKKNPLFHRREIKAQMSGHVAPSREEVRKALSEKLKTPEETIAIKTIKGKFGSKTFNIIANAYSSREELEKTETEKFIKESAKKTTEAPKEGGAN